MLKMSDLPFVWIFVHRPPDTPFLDPSFEFSRTSESSLVKKLGEELYAAKGDVIAYRTVKKMTDSSSRLLPAAKTDYTNVEPGAAFICLSTRPNF